MKKLIFNAFTLVEILLALAILAVGLVGILSVFAVGTNSIRRSIAMTEASFIAQMVFADHKLRGYDNINSGGGSVIYNSQDNPIYPDYSYRADVSAVIGINGLKKIELTIRYKNNDLLNFTTYISKYVP